MDGKGNISSQTHKMHYDRIRNVGMLIVFLHRKVWKAKNAFKYALRIQLMTITIIAKLSYNHNTFKKYLSPCHDSFADYKTVRALHDQWE